MNKIRYHCSVCGRELPEDNRGNQDRASLGDLLWSREQSINEQVGRYLLSEYDIDSIVCMHCWENNAGINTDSKKVGIHFSINEWEKTKRELIEQGRADVLNTLHDDYLDATDNGLSGMYFDVMEWVDEMKSAIPSKRKKEAKE